MDNEVPNLRPTGMTTLAFVLGPVLAALGFFGSIMWQASKYPDRSEFNALVSQTTSLSQTVAVTADRQARMAVDIQGVVVDVQAIRQHEDKRGGR